MLHLCFVCMGNICRSPTAHGIMLHLVKQAGLVDALVIDSAGTGGWHAGELPDSRTRAAAKKRGIELVSRARQFVREDFERFDYVLAMDDENVAHLHRLAPDAAARAKVVLLRSFDPESPDGAAVPDPYYGGPEGFDEVFDICQTACTHLLAHLVRQHGLA